MTDEKVSKQIGNIKITVDRNSNQQAFKCPYLNCDFYSFNYNELQQHKILTHAEFPKVIINDNTPRQRFSKERLRNQNMFILKYTLSTYKTIIGLMLGGGNRNGGRSTLNTNIKH